MPDDIATRATMMLTLGIFACLGVGALTSWLWQALARRNSRGPGMAGASVGGVVGLLLFGAGMSWVVHDMVGVAWQRLAHPHVQGELLGFDDVTLRETRGGRVVKGRGPLVEFTSADGQLHEIRGLSGSQSKRQAGEAVPVRVHPLDPSLSVLADFQNQYAALALFGGIAAAAWLLALLTACRAYQTVRPPRLAPSRFERWRDSDLGQRARKGFSQLAMATGALSIVGVFVMAEFIDVGRAMAGTLFGVAVALLQQGCAAGLEKGQGGPLALMGWAIGATAMASFAAMLWGLSA